MQRLSPSHPLGRSKSIPEDVWKYQWEMEELARYLCHEVEPGPRGPGAAGAVTAPSQVHMEVMLRTLLHRVVGSETRRIRRRSRVSWVDGFLDVLIDTEMVGAIVDAEELTGELQTRLSVLEAFAGLPDNYRTAMLLREGRGATLGEIAAAMGITAGAVRSILYRARHQLRRDLDL